MFGDSEVKDAVFAKLDKWLNEPPDFHDVDEAYKERGKLQSERIKLLRAIEQIEDDVVLEHGKPRSNEARILKLTHTRTLRDALAILEADIAENDSRCKLLEFRRSMFSAAIYRTKISMDL